MIIARKLSQYDLHVIERIVDRRHVGESQDATVAHVMTRFNRKVTLTPDAIEQVDATVRARKLSNLKEYQLVMGGRY
jgi:hypothetical protein